MSGHQEQAQKIEALRQAIANYHPQTGPQTAAPAHDKTNSAQRDTDGRGVDGSGAGGHGTDEGAVDGSGAGGRGSAGPGAGKPGVGAARAFGLGAAEDPEMEKIRASALRSLAAAPRSRHELTKRMMDKDYDPALTETLMDRFEEVGLLDDLAYAQTIVRTRLAERGHSHRALGHELTRRGISKTVQREALQEIDGDQWYQGALETVQRRLRVTRGLEPHVRRRRIMATLARKGHGPETARRALEEGLANEQTQNQDTR